MTDSVTELLRRAMLGLLCAVGVLTAQEPAVVPPAAEDASAQLARAALQRWSELEHRPAQLALRGGSVRLRFELRGDRGDADGSATYSWHRDDDEAASELVWQPPELGQRLAREGWSQRDLDRQFLGTDVVDGDAQVSAEQAASGTVVTLTGEPSGLRRVELGADGLPRRLEFSVENGAMEFTLTPRYEKRGERHVLVEQAFDMNMAFGAVRSVSRHTYREIDGMLLPESVVEESTFNGQPAETRTVRFDGWQLDRRPEGGAEDKRAG